MLFSATKVNHNKAKSVLSLITKLMAGAIGLFLVLYGLMGFIGLNFAGAHVEWSTRMTGLFMVIMGLVYICPNSKIILVFRKKTIYYGVCGVPYLMIVLSGVFTVVESGWGIYQMHMCILLSLVGFAAGALAPLSYCLSISKDNIKEKNN